ncbi:MAG: T9SS type A sorting domain-containing protein, partial [Ignavibacteria bacterium]|nr:T9SS type A sorting domain-containing protein [Ignavibacteria bacterium]
NKSYADVNIFQDKIISVWNDTRNDPFDVYCNIRSFTNPDTTVSIIQTSQSIPENFSLYQNFPNPINSSTQIKFDINQNNYYKLEIFNYLGQSIQKLFEKNLNSGTYHINFESDNISSGIYYYILSSPKERFVESFVLLK